MGLKVEDWKPTCKISNRKQDLAKGKIMPSQAKLGCWKISLTNASLSKETVIVANMNWEPPGTISVKFSSFLGQLQYEIFYNIIFYVNQEFTDIQMKFNRHSIPIQLTFIDSMSIELPMNVCWTAVECLLNWSWNEPTL